MSALDKYIGKIIKEFEFSADVLILAFEDNDKLELYAQGDCCSSSWFEQISGEEALISRSVLGKIELIYMAEVFPNVNKLARNLDNDEVIQSYGLKIVTSNGYANIDMRNSSNGYYGGYITINDKNAYSGKSLHPGVD